MIRLPIDPAEEAEIAAELNLSLDDYRQKLTEMEALNIGELEFVRDENDTSVVLQCAASPGEESPALLLERACRVPPPPDDEDQDGSTPGQPSPRR